jgi:hypothetical protein
MTVSFDSIVKELQLCASIERLNVKIWHEARLQEFKDKEKQCLAAAEVYEKASESCQYVNDISYDCSQDYNDLG